MKIIKYANLFVILLEFVLDFVYVNLQYDEISLTFTAGSVSLCILCWTNTCASVTWFSERCDTEIIMFHSR